MRLGVIDPSWPRHTAVASTGVPSLELRLNRETKTGGAGEDAASFPPEAKFQGVAASRQAPSLSSPQPGTMESNAPTPQGPAALAADPPPMRGSHAFCESNSFYSELKQPYLEPEPPDIKGRDEEKFHCQYESQNDVEATAILVANVKIRSLQINVQGNADFMLSSLFSVAPAIRSLNRQCVFSSGFASREHRALSDHHGDGTRCSLEAQTSH
ncbi:hypothetical protein NDU88_002495 [Pleurodeles waltl]|uniref:Uncharacterized protein n=1 Tax=Pleurodeles waltl TaxID=8319 RepID=A0AAV7RFW7_PLEWA|nr:hypothetical protein NDU88_002495 [Pleurodeles waltl]